MITLCEKCVPESDEVEVLCVMALNNCEQCGSRHDNHVFRKDPRPALYLRAHARLSKACELLKEASKRTDDYWSDGIAGQIDAFLKEIGHETN